MNATDLPANLVSKISTDCWSWTGATNSKGYPCVSIQGRTTLAHRYVYEMVHGPIAEGMPVDHLCRNIRCVRPDHLEVVTRQVNDERRRDAYIECRRGHALTGENVREHRRSNGRITRECRACGIEAQRRLAERKKGAPIRPHRDRVDTSQYEVAS